MQIMHVDLHPILSGNDTNVNEARKDNPGHFGSFKYNYQHKPNIPVNDGNPLNLPAKY